MPGTTDGHDETGGAIERGTVTQLGLLLPVTGSAEEQRDRLRAVREAGSAAERSGFDSLWIEGSLGRREPYTVLGALAASTSAIRLGARPDPSDRRAPGLLAKIVAGLDVVSHGRAVLSVTRAPDDGDGELLSEWLQGCRAVLVEERPVFHGRHVVIEGAVNRPAPVQPGGVPLVVFFGGEDPPGDGPLRAAVRFADGVVLGSAGAAFGEALGVVHDELSGSARGAGALEVIWHAELAAGPEAGAGTDLRARSDELAAEAAGHIAEGAGGCIVSVPDPHGPEAIELVGDVVGAAVRAALAKRGVSRPGT